MGSTCLGKMESFHRAVGDVCSLSHCVSVPPPLTRGAVTHHNQLPWMVLAYAVEGQDTCAHGKSLTALPPPPIASSSLLS